MRRQLRLRLWKKQNGLCVYCKEKMWVGGYHKPAGRRHKASLEHKRPRSLGGSDTGRNIVCSCVNCNGRRGTIPHWQFKIIRKLPYWQEIIRAYRRNGQKWCWPLFRWYFNILKNRKYFRRKLLPYTMVFWYPKQIFNMIGIV